MSVNEKEISGIIETVLRNVIEQLGDEPAGLGRTPLPQASYENPNGGLYSLRDGFGEKKDYTSSLSDPIPVELSARHVHLSEKDAIALFGGPLTPARELSQPGQFLCKERVRLIGPKGVMDNVAVLGPSRGHSQVEVSKTDARILGIDAPVRQSGDIENTPGIVLASIDGIVGLEQGVIVASRHIHMGPADAKRLGVHDREKVKVRLDSDRPLTLEEVLVRVDDSFKLALHIDPDEGNGAGWNKSVTGRIVSSS